ncbi:MAG: hypothetical protein ACRDAS_01880 [Cetobacterium sp.]
MDDLNFFISIAMVFFGVWNFLEARQSKELLEHLKQQNSFLESLVKSTREDCETLKEIDTFNKKLIRDLEAENYELKLKYEK